MSILESQFHLNCELTASRIRSHSQRFHLTLLTLHSQPEKKKYRNMTFPDHYMYTFVAIAVILVVH